MTRKFDRFMVHVDIGTDEKLAGLTDSERLCHIAGVLALAAKSPIRGTLLVGDIEATTAHIARRASVSTRVAASTMRKLQEAGVLVRNEEIGCWEVHRWDAWQVEPSADKTAARRQALHRDLPLRTVIRERDGDECRYCGVPVVWQDRRSGLGGTYDHVDPDGPNAAWNLVVACRACNSRKGDQTPEAAGMTLRPEPTSDQPRINSTSTPEVEVEGKGRTDVGATSNVVSLPSGVAPSARGSNDGWGVAP